MKEEQGVMSDVLYGEFLLDEVLVELINSPEVQRLKDIHMIGPSYLLNPLWNETRYEHSVGVMLLVKKLGGSLQEQVAGLLHDISHTIFSHVIDVVMKKPKEDYHEEIQSQYLAESSIPLILAKYGLADSQVLLDDSRWQILEQSAPLLCADRIDYTLREVYRYYQVDIHEIHQFLGSISIREQKIVLDSVQAGEWFIEQYRRIVIDLFYAPVNMYGYEKMSEILAYCLNQQLLLESDLMKTETEVLAYLTSLEDRRLKGLLQAFYEPVSFQAVAAETDYDIYQKKKTRLVDPLIFVEGKLAPTTTFSAVARELHQQTLAKSQAGVYLVVRKADK